MISPSEVSNIVSKRIKGTRAHGLLHDDNSKGFTSPRNDLTKEEMERISLETLDRIKSKCQKKT